MKIIITGHTKGVGKRIYDYFSSCPENEVIGISRTTGYDLTTDIDKVVDIATGCDLFINNTCVDDAQLTLLTRMYDKVSKMIVLGSRMGDYNHIFNTDYSHFKNKLKEKCHNLSLLPHVTLLYINISQLEDAPGMELLIPFDKVVQFIKFWLDDSMLTSATFEIKMSEHNLDIIKSKFNVSHFHNLIKDES